MGKAEQTAYEEFAAERNEEINVMALSKKPELYNRVMHLMNTPGDRRVNILMDAIEAEVIEEIDATGDAAQAEAYWDKVADLVILSWGDLMMGAAGNQSRIFEDAQDVIYYAAQRQAMIEVGHAQMAVRIGRDSERERKKVVADMSSADMRAIKLDIKGAVKRKADAKKKAAKDAG